MLRRKQTCARAFDVFVEGLQYERADALRSGPSRRHPLRRLASASRDAWQRFAIRIGHDHIVRPVLKAQREVLDAWDRVRRRAP